jgi:hypothetical protein
MLDEKKHYGWILALLRKYDPDQYAQFLEFKNANPAPSNLSKPIRGPEIK